MGYTIDDVQKALQPNDVNTNALPDDVDINALPDDVSPATYKSILEENMDKNNNSSLEDDYGFDNAFDDDSQEFEDPEAEPSDELSDCEFNLFEDEEPAKPTAGMTDDEAFDTMVDDLTEPGEGKEESIMSNIKDAKDFVNNNEFSNSDDIWGSKDPFRTSNNSFGTQFGTFGNDPFGDPVSANSVKIAYYEAIKAVANAYNAFGSSTEQKRLINVLEKLVDKE